MFNVSPAANRPCGSYRKCGISFLKRLRKARNKEAAQLTIHPNILRGWCVTASSVDPTGRITGKHNTEAQGSRVTYREQGPSLWSLDRSVATRASLPSETDTGNIASFPWQNSDNTRLSPGSSPPLHSPSRWFSLGHTNKGREIATLMPP